MRNRIVNNLNLRMEYNKDTGDLIVHTDISKEGDEQIPFEALMRAYICLGSNLQKINQKIRYNIENDGDNDRVVERIIEEFEND